MNRYLVEIFDVEDDLMLRKYIIQTAENMEDYNKLNILALNRYNKERQDGDEWLFEWEEVYFEVTDLNDEDVINYDKEQTNE